MLGGNHGNTLMEHVIAHFTAVLYNIGEMALNLLPGNMLHRKPHIGHIILFHLLPDFRRQNIPGQKFIHKPLLFCVVKHGSLPPDRLRNEKSPLFFRLRIQGGGMYLDIINVLQLNAVGKSHRNTVPGKLGKISGMAVKPSDSAAGQYGLACCNCLNLTL